MTRPLVVPTPARAADPPPRLHSPQLFGPHRELEILHQGQVYRLRQTQQGKLILTK